MESLRTIHSHKVDVHSFLLVLARKPVVFALSLSPTDSAPSQAATRTDWTDDCQAWPPLSYGMESTWNLTIETAPVLYPMATTP